ncbi:Gfo/Idh/MocA family oxidoreductase, partial [Candidatus Aerophobetes bacterium]|nr:Gfo/Idh/MocA family oxidoreductase [Candidatus Aerophobetes bacterium]
MKKVKVGIVGCGFAADLHVRALRMVRGIKVEIAGVASRTRESSERFARKFGIEKHYNDYRYLLEDKDIDVIDVCTPNYLHKKICVESAQAGK